MSRSWLCLVVYSREHIVLNTREQAVTFITNQVSAISGLPLSSIDEQTKLLGGGSVLNSMRLVELLLAVEEFAEDTLGVRFDWASDSAMSEARSSYRTIGSLCDHIAHLASASN